MEICFFFWGVIAGRFHPLFSSLSLHFRFLVSERAPPHRDLPEVRVLPLGYARAESGLESFTFGDPGEVLGGGGLIGFMGGGLLDKRHTST